MGLGKSTVTYHVHSADFNNKAKVDSVPWQTMHVYFLFDEKPNNLRKAEVLLVKLRRNTCASLPLLGGCWMTARGVQSFLISFFIHSIRCPAMFQTGHQRFLDLLTKSNFHSVYAYLSDTSLCFKWFWIQPLRNRSPVFILDFRTTPTGNVLDERQKPWNRGLPEWCHIKFLSSNRASILVWSFSRTSWLVFNFWHFHCVQQDCVIRSSLLRTEVKYSGRQSAECISQFWNWHKLDRVDAVHNAHDWSFWSICALTGGEHVSITLIHMHAFFICLLHRCYFCWPRRNKMTVW